MKFIYTFYNIIITISLTLSIIGIYIINTYQLGFFGGFIAGVISAVAIGLLLTPKSKFLKQ